MSVKKEFSSDSEPVLLPPPEGSGIVIRGLGGHDLEISAPRGSRKRPIVLSEENDFSEMEESFDECGSVSSNDSWTEMTLDEVIDNLNELKQDLKLIQEDIACLSSIVYRQLRVNKNKK